MKIAFGMIVFEGDYVLQQCLEQVYPFAEQILISEGPVEFWQRQGRTTSLDDTNKILDEFPAGNSSSILFVSSKEVVLPCLCQNSTGPSDMRICSAKGYTCSKHCCRT